jgi:transposase
VLPVCASLVQPIQLGLRNQPGQGRKAILKVEDLPQIKAKVQQNPQHLKAVRQELKVDLQRNFSDKTLRRFLKSLVRSGGDVGVSV